jgi:plastocyanin
VAQHGALKRLPTLRRVAAAGGLLLLAFFAATGVSGRAESATPPVQVRVSLFGFTPSTRTVQAGTTVTWLNDDERPHTVTSADGFFASQAIASGESFSFRFDTRGVYPYFSGFQPDLMGTIVVR